MTVAIIKARRGRAVWLKLHLFLALSAGFLFALLGITGSLGIYGEEIDEWLNPGLVIDKPHGDYQPLDKIIAAVRAAHPGRHGAWTLEMPSSPYGMITIWFEKPRETYFEWYAPLMVSVNPYTAEVVANRFWGDTFTTRVLDLHSHFCLGLSGRYTVGALGLLLMLSAVSGLLLWWPDVKGILKAMAIRRRSGLLRFVSDLHRMTGFLSALALLTLAGTGVLLSYPAVLENLAGAAGMGHGETDRTLLSTSAPNGRPIGLEAAEFIARSAFPGGKLQRLTTPVGADGVYEIRFRQQREINQRHPFSTVWMDRWSGHILAVRDPSRFSAGQKLAAWVWPLHSGEALGKTGRLLWFLAGQALFFLYLSGLFRWLCHRGVVQNRAVDFTTLQTGSYRFRALISQLGFLLWRLAAASGQQTLPLLLILGRTLSRWLHSLKNDLRH
jgi:uncharacterized iron-regulated membrane protein